MVSAMLGVVRETDGRRDIPVMGKGKLRVERENLQELCDTDLFEVIRWISPLMKALPWRCR